MISLIKSTARLLLRSKGFLFFLLVTPIISTLLLSLNKDYDLYVDHADTEIVELSRIDARAVYKSNGSSFVVKVYDGSRTELSEYALNKLAANGMFTVCREDVTDLSAEDVTEQINKDGFDDRAGVIVYLKKDFDSAVMNDSLSEGIELFISSDDEREELFETELCDLLSNIYRAGTLCGGDTAKTTEMLDSAEENMPEMNVTEIVSEDKLVLTNSQSNSSVQIGYAFLSMTLGFIITGAFVAHTVIKEEHNKVFTRLLLTGRSTALYFVSKFAVLIVVSFIETAILGVCLLFVRGLDLGMSMPVFLAIIFALGVILGSVCMLTGILFDDIMSTYYAAFALWCISSMMSGMAFPIEESSDTIKALAGFMPQKWFLDIAKKFIAGLSGTFSMMFFVTAAYLIVIISVGSVCLKIKKQEP